MNEAGDPSLAVPGLEVPLHLSVEHGLDGSVLDPAERVTLALEVSEAEWGAALEVRFEAPYAGDPPPRAPVGSTFGLWEHEVVELFLVGPFERYLELELGPHGHYLGLWLEGVRQIVRRDLEVAYTTTLAGGRWHGVARVPTSLLPRPLERLNAFSIRGVGAERRYSGASPLVGPPPDFHALGSYPTLAEARRRSDLLTSNRFRPR